MTAPRSSARAGPTILAIGLLLAVSVLAGAQTSGRPAAMPGASAPVASTSPTVGAASAPPGIDCAHEHPSDLVPPRTDERAINLVCAAKWLTSHRSGGVASDVSSAPPGFGLYNLVLSDDPSDGYVLLVGATGIGAENGTQTWAFSPGSWHQLAPAVYPESCVGSVMAYDSTDGYVVYYGGGNLLAGQNCTAAGTTWTFHGGVWTNVTPVVSPAPRQAAAMTNDSADGYLLLFGGLSAGCGGGSCGGTWSFHGGHWTELAGVTHPSNRSGAGMTDDLTDGYVLLFGGTGDALSCRPWYDDLGCMFNDSWGFSAGTWTQLHPVGALPPEPYDDGLAYDAALGVDLYTVADDNQTPDPEIYWTFHGGNWTNPGSNDQAPQNASQPPDRFGEGLAYDWTDGFAVMYGGTAVGFAALNDTWEYNATGWTSLTGPATAPAYYPVTFAASGLPSYQLWNVTLAGQTLVSNLARIVFLEPNGTYPFSVGTQAGASPTPSAGTVVVSGAPREVPVLFSTGVGTGIRRNVTFSESGLPAGDTWSVTLAGATLGGAGDRIVFAETPGSYTFSIQVPAGLIATANSSEVNVTSSPVAVAVAVAALPSQFHVQFTAGGLPPGRTWYVSLGGGTIGGQGSSISFQVPGGSYAFNVTGPTGYLPTPATGRLDVASDVEVAISLAAVDHGPDEYPVTFALAAGSFANGWGVSINGTAEWTNGSQLAFVLPNGTYPFTVNVSGRAIAPVPSVGAITVAGSPLYVRIDFEAVGVCACPSQTAPPSVGIPTLLAIAALVAALTVGAVATSLAISRYRRPPLGPDGPP